MVQMSTKTAKEIVRNRLLSLDIPFTKLTARTVDFTDLAREKVIYVKIHGWQPCPALIGIRRLAKECGFRVETDYGGVNG